MNTAMTEIEIEIDKSHLPRVYDVCQCFSVLEDGALAHSLQEQEIEQFYSSNVQKNQAVQSDVRLARRLQEEEERRARLGHQLRQMEEQDCEYAKMIQEELRRRDEEAQKREEEDEEMAKRMQEEEELEMQRQRTQTGYHGDSRASPLSEGLELWEQLVRDAELARILQEEEDRQPHQKSRGSDVDFRTAQVAQDEEIARYMQRQERKNSRKSHDLETQERSFDLRGADNTTSRKVEPLQMPRERLNSQGLHSPVEEEHTLEQHPLSPACTTLRTQPVHNIAEELDPTFTARKRDSQISPSLPSGICLAPRTPHSIFYDYLPEPTFVPPTRRHNDKPGRPKAKEKRENCKQQ
ncbi:hypothetical protein MHYP_G00272870 [Metynnis hypsauchen]